MFLLHDPAKPVAFRIVQNMSGQSRTDLRTSGWVTYLQS
jgi:hypothetical protein